MDPDLSGTLSNTAQVTMVGDANVLNNTGVAGIGLLPNTGFELGGVLGSGLLLLALGAGLLLLARRREESDA